MHTKEFKNIDKKSIDSTTKWCMFGFDKAQVDTTYWAFLRL